MDFTILHWMDNGERNTDPLTGQSKCKPNRAEYLTLGRYTAHTSAPHFTQHRFMEIFKSSPRVLVPSAKRTPLGLYWRA